MFTIKYVGPDGSESITECAHVRQDRTSDGKIRVLVFDVHPSESGDNNSGVYCESECVSNACPPGAPVLYVMNRFGSTVATYRL